MKKILLFISLSIAAVGLSQSSLVITNTNASATLAPNAIIYLTTTAGNNVKRILDIKNISVSTKSYVVVRYDVQLNAGSSAYYCFAGSCFGPSTITSPSTLVLSSGASASSSTVAFNMLTADHDEAATVGQSIVKYSFKNIAVIADSVQIVMKYNYPDPMASVQEFANPFKSFEISPNPANDNINISLNFKGSDIGEISLINAIGQTVYAKPISFNDGKNKLNINVNELPNGIYFAKVKSGDFISTKKIIIQ